MPLINWLGSPVGRTFVLNALVASGFLLEWLGIPWAEDYTIAACCVAMAQISWGDIPAPGQRILAAMAMLATGVAGTYISRPLGTVISLLSLAVLLEKVQGRKDSGSSP